MVFSPSSPQVSTLALSRQAVNALHPLGFLLALQIFRRAIRRFRERIPYPMIYLLLPAYNEAPEIAPLFASIDRELADFNERIEIVLVDDASTDGTGKLARETPCKAAVRVLSHQDNQGLGGALLTGFKAIVACSPASNDVIVAMDTDNTHSPGYIPALVEKLRREQLDLVVASRYAPGGREIGVSALRRLLSRSASVFYRWLYRTPGISDYTCGYRAYRAGAIQKALEHYGDGFVEEKGFPSTGEIFLKVRALGGRLGEIPFALHYENKHTASKMPKLKTILSTFRILLKHRRGYREAAGDQRS